jgi:hypothetical protein
MRQNISRLIDEPKFEVPWIDPLRSEDFCILHLQLAIIDSRANTYVIRAHSKSNARSLELNDILFEKGILLLVPAYPQAA